MIKFENTEVVGWEAAIRGMRNPMNSWEKSDSGQGCSVDFVNRRCLECDRFNNEYEYGMCVGRAKKFVIGPKDLDLMMRLRNAGTDHRKFMRMITVYVDITAPLYWWKEFDTYEDFSCEHICISQSIDILKETVDALNVFRDVYLNGSILKHENRNMRCYGKKDKDIWWQMIQLLPSSYNQKRTVMLNYEVLANIYKSRKNHKLDEWCEHPVTIEKINVQSVGLTRNGFGVAGTVEESKPDYFGFCDWIETLPYSELITCKSLTDVPICNEIMEEAKKRNKEE